MILTSDLHLTANPADEYRWRVFDELDRLCRNDKRVYILGDVTDLRDRHPSELVNPMIEALDALVRHRKAEITILMGNHDRALETAAPYWSFLSRIPGLSFIREPTAKGKLLLLPYTANPAEEWDGIDFTLYHAAFIHQSLDGADIGHGRTYKSRNKETALNLPSGFKIYSGDIHVPQVLRFPGTSITYVGAPHPVRFGDDHACRMLILDDATFEIVQEVKLAPPRKSVIEISNLRELRDVAVSSGDKVRVRYVMPLDRIGTWPEDQRKLIDWAKARGVELVGMEPIVQTDRGRDGAGQDLHDPMDVLAAFVNVENLDDALLEVALDLMDEAKGVARQE
jgi:calcineurin-like phosphoesterase family protein